jgi:hypothetical protein
MAGAYFLLVTNEDDWLRTELSKDSTFLLLRPVSVADSVPQSEKDVSRRYLDAAGSVIGYRDQLLRAVTRLRVAACRDNLEAIVLDPESNKHGLSGYEAKQAIAAIEGTANSGH